MSVESTASPSSETVTPAESTDPPIDEVQEVHPHDALRNLLDGLMLQPPNGASAAEDAV